MPGLITHYICGEAIYNNLSEDRKKVILEFRQLYNIGTQGPDIFFYYLPGLLNKNLKELGTKMHKDDFKIFIESMIDSVHEEKNIKNKKAALSYLCGYITHYALDYNTHPYIYYKSGFRQEGERTLKYSVYHRNFETAIDVLMLKLLSGEKPSDKKLWQLIKTNYQEAMHVSNIMSEAITKAYGAKITGKHVYNAISYMSRINRILQSTKGRRKRFMQLAENLTIGENVVSSLIHLQDINDGRDYLNIQEKSRQLPWDEESQYNYSFTYLYNKSVKEGTEIVNSVFNFFEGNLDKAKLMRIIGNNSLATGIDCGEKVKFKFSDIIFE